MVADMESLLCLIINASSTIKDTLFSRESKPRQDTHGKVVLPCVGRWYLFGFQWSQRFSLKPKQAKIWTLLPLLKFIVKCLEFPPKAMAFHHLGNGPVAIPIEIKKNPLFLGTTACRTDSRTPLLSLTLKTKTSIFKTAEVSSNSSRAGTMMAWFRS